MDAVIPLLAVLWTAAHTDAPPLSDLGRFPARPVSQASLKFANAHDDWLRSVVELEPNDPGWMEWRMEHLKIKAIWAALENAQDGVYSDCQRRKYLIELRELIGPADYGAGIMPPPAPIWRFQRMP